MIDQATLARALAARRQKYFEEIDRDPQLAAYVRGVAASENGGHPSGILESMMNRASMNNRASLWDEIKSGFYGPVNRGQVQPMPASPAYDQAFQRVRSGSNDIALNTDQGMQNEHKPAASVGIQPTLINGEWYSPMGQKGLDWKAAVEKEAEAQRGGSLNGGYGMSPTGTAGISGPAQTATPIAADSRFVDLKPPAPLGSSPAGGSVTGSGYTPILGNPFLDALKGPGGGSGSSGMVRAPDTGLRVDVGHAQAPRVDVASLLQAIQRRAYGLGKG